MSRNLPRGAAPSRRRLLKSAALAAGAVVVAGGITGRDLLGVAATRAKDAVVGDRVAAAKQRLGDALQQSAAAQGIAWPPKEVFVRAFKTGDDGVGPGRVEAWVSDGKGPLQRLQSHPLCALSGVLGPKRHEGDLQIPEGYYTISAMNPKSSYHLSLRVDYPNRSDRIRGRRLDAKAPLGGDIMVHGNCVTIGCLPIEDEPIEELYLLIAQVFGKKVVPIHIFPRPMTPEALAALQSSPADAETKRLWQELAVGYAAFEETKKVPTVTVAADGAYVVEPRAN